MLTSTPTKISSKTTAGSKPKAPVWAFVLRNLLWTAPCVVAMILGLELLFAAAHVGEEQFVAVDPVIGIAHIPHKLLTWRSEGYGQTVLNGAGFHDVEWQLAKPPGVKRIVIMGDSMMEGLQVNLPNTLASVLQRELDANPGQRYQVMNFAISGSSTVQDLYLFKNKIAQYQPDICVLGYHVGDNEKNILTDYVQYDLPRPYCRLDKTTGRLVTDWSNFEPTDKKALSAAYAAKTQFLREYSRLWDVLTKADLQMSQVKGYDQIRSLAKTAVSGGKKLAGYKDQHGADSDTLADIVGKDSPVQLTSLNQILPSPPAFAERPMPAGLPPKLEREIKSIRYESVSWRAIMEATRQRFAVTAGILEVLNADCAANHCKLVVMSLPAANNAKLFYKELQGVQTLAKHDNFYYVDGGKHFPNLAPLDKSPLYYYAHFSPLGHRLMAQTLLEGLKANKLVD